MGNRQMTKKELSVWAYLNEAVFCLKNGQDELALNYTLDAREILEGKRIGDFEDEFLDSLRQN